MDHYLNRDSYNRIAASWDQTRVVFFGREKDYLDTFLKDLVSPSQILDLGCGTGRPLAEAVLARGHQVVGIDQSENLLQLARERFPQAVWLQSSLEDFAFQGSYEGVILWDTLFHLERSYHAPLLAKISHCLVPGGKLMLTVGGSAHPCFVDMMFGELFFYDSYPPEAVLAILQDLNFQPLISEFMNLPTPDRDKGRYAIVARKL